MKKIIFTVSLIALLSTVTNKLFSQVNITGPTCVVQGTIYQYDINGSWDSTSTMNLCVQGGTIADSINLHACITPEKPVSFAMVEWDTLGPVSISVASSPGNVTLNVTVVKPLIPGALDSASSFQNIGYDSIPADIICAADQGGSCSPVYNDQWQQSSDQMIWADIPGATSQNLTLTDSLQKTTYFRRKVIELNSGTVGYSDVAIVSVASQPTGFNTRPPEKHTTIIAYSIIAADFNYKNL